MKLLKKLVPLTVLATTASIVTPMVTSCSNSSKWDVDWNEKDGTYIPKVDIHEATKEDDEPTPLADATKAYFDAIVNDHKIFAQDLAMSWLYDFQPDLDVFQAAPDNDLEVLQIKVTDIVKDEDLSQEGTGKIGLVYRISFTLHMEGKIWFYDPASAWYYNSFDLNFNNVPYRVSIYNHGANPQHSLLTIYDTTLKPTYGRQQAYRDLSDLDDWSIDVSYSTLTSSVSRTIDYKSSPGQTMEFNAFDTTIINMGDMGGEYGLFNPVLAPSQDGYPSYYMSKVITSA